jgi:hypothetical protein
MSDNTSIADELSGKVALVTGASRGIGRASALALARAGADVAVNFHSREHEAKAVCLEIERCGRRSLAVQADVSVATSGANGGGRTPFAVSSARGRRHRSLFVGPNHLLAVPRHYY